MERLDAAILRTILYADVFSFALNLEEIHRFLIHDETTSPVIIKKQLETSPILHQILYQSDDYYCLNIRKELIELRQNREEQTKHLMMSARRYGIWLAMIPFVRMVALTGALAVRNPASKKDDFDYLLVTKVGRVWTARLFAVTLVRIVRFLGRELCPNYVLSENQLLQSRQDSFVAHEIAQMLPIYGDSMYQQMLDENRWALKYLPNLQAYHAHNVRPFGLKVMLEWLLTSKLGDWLETWEFERKRQKFSQETQEESSALIDEQQAKGHFKDNGHPILRQYHARLREYGLLDDALPMAGD